VIGAVPDVSGARYCDSVDDEGKNTYNVLDVALGPGVPPPDPGVERNFYTTSSCGVCGKASLDAVRLKTRFSPPPTDGRPVRRVDLAARPAAYRAARVREHRWAARGRPVHGGRHAARGPRGPSAGTTPVDKVLGWALLQGRIPAAAAC